MVHNKKEFTGGLVALVLFFVVLFYMFQPMFNGLNSMAYLDALYNSISKGSVYYIPMANDEAEKVSGKDVNLVLHYVDENIAAQSAAQMAAAGVAAEVKGTDVEVAGSLKAILSASIADADYMYHNDGDSVSAKYDGINPRRASYNWWVTLGQIDRALSHQEDFAAAKVVNTVQTRAVETAYNYFKIEPMHISDKLGTVIFSLAFYVFYTLWYGYAILWVFEGWGLRLSH
ncbi:hypothetical protein GKC30_10040 [Pseudodesulfovibrio sp. F-1]|uniref:Uncharacterized protein n=1 Tax=Pseudodesulfovibrio alkaliphilus TaxID=2661613 RepID=A0A7K1KPF7_9BACT|nr:hypothetical protein [Pseudodesulfovibrio alkaliphilus]MUM77974.1 hypothetical protein [Pseudodesulfovibrio alkaliphilus]